MATTPTVSGYTSAQTAGGDSTFVVDPSANIVSGSIATDDWVVIIFSSQTNISATRIPTPPGDWTSILPFDRVGTGNMTFGIWAHRRLQGETTYTWSQDANSGGSNYKMCFVRGAGDINTWITGAFTYRSNTGTSTTNVATSITTTTNNTLALLLSGERTTAAETDSQVTCTAFTKVYFDNVIDSSLLIGTLDMVSAGPTGSSTITYPNAQTNNGIAGIIGISPFISVSEPVAWLI